MISPDDLKTRMLSGLYPEALAPLPAVLPLLITIAITVGLLALAWWPAP